MTDKDTITLPREVVEKAVKAFENGCPPTCENGMIDSGGLHPWGQPALVPCPACLAFEHLRTALAAEQPKHPGYIIGSHWLETAYSRVCAGEAEDAILEDYEVVREPRLRDLRRDAERWRFYEAAGSDLTLRLHNTRSDHRNAAIDAALQEDKR